MERVTAPIWDLRQRPGTPPPAGREATEDGGQRYAEVKSASDLSDTYPAGCAEYHAEDDPHAQGNFGGGRSENGAQGPAAPVKHPHDTKGNAGRGDAKLVGSADAPVGHRCNRREVSLDVRLSVRERDAIRHRAQMLGVRPSAWARAVMLDGLDVRSERLESLEITAKESVEAPQLLSFAPAVEQLRRVGVNLNQALRKSVAIDEDLLHEVIAALDDVRASLGDRTRA